jgi:thiosulfate/3-mercaptopyruvate sulfurtransferase
MFRFSILLFAILFAENTFAQNPVNWTQKELMDPAQLAEIITSGKNVPIIISVGPGAIIPKSIDIGMVGEEKNLDKLKLQLKNISRDKEIIIYCGCCPFEHCPNVRPAIAALKEMKFSNYYLLNIPQNIRKDWIDKGYPKVDSQ